MTVLPGDVLKISPVSTVPNLYGYEFDHEGVLQHAMWCWTPTRSKAKILRLGSERGSEC
jgi:hypothetical protein